MTVGFAISREGVDLAYVVAAIAFVIGIKALSSPRTARRGNVVAAGGMVVAIAFTFTLEEVQRYWFVAAGMLVGAVIGVVAARFVRMTAMPQMVALLNGLGGGAAALVAISEFDDAVGAPFDPEWDLPLAASLSVLIGSVTFSGSIIAFAKLQELLAGRPIVFRAQKPLNALLAAAAVALMVWAWLGESMTALVLLIAVALLLGVLFVLPIGGADMPVVIALLNAFSGLSGVATGFVLENNALIIGGSLVGASGTLLTILMGRAMNRSISNVLFGAFGQVQSGAGQERTDDGRTVRATTAADVAVQLSYASKVIIVPGYGLAVSQAQHDVRQLAQLLEERSVEVVYAIHPVAGRMPGHMNVLLAEANVPYDQLREMDRVNPEFPQADVALVIGANDVVNPAARSDPGSPIYGMPILDVDKAASIVVMKRSMATGFAGIDNELFLDDKTTMLFGNAKDSIIDLIAAVKEA
jgi:proton-translocating NAD(P)+ transhydrogenase subunit beta